MILEKRPRIHIKYPQLDLDFVKYEDDDGEYNFDKLYMNGYKRIKSSCADLLLEQSEVINAIKEQMEINEILLQEENQTYTDIPYLSPSYFL